MKIVSNEIALRPRFQLQLQQPGETVLTAFENLRQKPFHISRSEDHLFIKFNRERSHFWSPQLQLEIESTDETSCRLYGLFGPNPTLWTFFMFLHFGLATLFIVFGVWAYSSAALERPYTLQLLAMGLLVVIWFVLYAFGRLGKRKGKPQMLELYRFMTDTLEKSVISAGTQTA